MIFYSQSEGAWTDNNGVISEGWYSGNGQWKNDPASQTVHDHGPLPQGTYKIYKLWIPRNPQVPHLGPSMALLPMDGNEMFGRSGFFLHLDNPAHIGFSSDGCPVAPSIEELQKIEALRAAGEALVTVIA